jgi:hypothetical protein
MVQARAAALSATVQPSPSPRYWVAEAPLDHAAKAATLHARGCITRMPHTRQVVSPVITPARRGDTWPQLVMPFALRLYAMTQCRRRHYWARQGERVPTQRNPPTARPTWRGVFPLRAGIHRVRVTVPGQVHDLMEGRHEGHIKSLRWCGEAVCRLYPMSLS